MHRTHPARRHPGDRARKHITASGRAEPSASRRHTPGRAGRIDDATVAVDDGVVPPCNLDEVGNAVTTQVPSEQQGRFLFIRVQDERPRQTSPIDIREHAEPEGIQRQAADADIRDGFQGGACLVGLVESGGWTSGLPACSVTGAPTRSRWPTLEKSTSSQPFPAKRR